MTRQPTVSGQHTSHQPRPLSCVGYPECRSDVRHVQCNNPRRAQYRIVDTERSNARHPKTNNPQDTYHQLLPKTLLDRRVRSFCRHRTETARAAITGCCVCPAHDHQPLGDATILPAADPSTVHHASNHTPYPSLSLDMRVRSSKISFLLAPDAPGMEYCAAAQYSQNTHDHHTFRGSRSTGTLARRLDSNDPRRSPHSLKTQTGCQHSRHHRDELRTLAAKDESPG